MSDAPVTSGAPASSVTPAGNWMAASAPPAALASPGDLAQAPLEWAPASVPGTAAQALHAAGRWTLDEPRDFDAEDWWYRGTFHHAPGHAAEDGRVWLCSDGLATLAEVWLNGFPVLRSDNMFHRHRVDVTDRLRGGDNEIAAAFRALGSALAARRPRPRWKTRLVRQQQLRWIRTTLLGRIPGWSPPVAAAGPWRGLWMESRPHGWVGEPDLFASLDGDCGVVDVSCPVAAPAAARVRGEVAVGAATAALDATPDFDGWRLTARVRVPRPALWWPATHGDPAREPCTARIGIDGHERTLDWGSIGFRTLRPRQDDGGFALDVNGVPIFCRGACWTVEDIVSLGGSSAELARELALLRDAGANMVRVGGTMVYEQDAFYTLCDELGLLVWQDFMFANMDYPIEDAAFRGSVETEAAQQLQRLRRHPSIAVYCGGSEVEQQAAMLGLPRSTWRSALFADVLPGLCARWHPDVPYVPSTPTGGDLPFHTNAGVSHYYGVGAYRRPIDDVRRADVRFTPECLGFANVPSPEVVREVMRDDPAATHDPRWKTRTPRDSGAGWDFEDVRDHYVRDLFSVDPAALRSADPLRYLELGRVTTGEMMARVFAEWRSAHSRCRGALVWFLKDLWPGAGWGLLDSRGDPKACFYFLRRAWQPRAVLITDEGLNGLDLHVVNDSPRPLTATLDLMLLRAGHVVVAHETAACDLPARGSVTIGADALLGAFCDVSYAYRFGPPGHDVVAATLIGPDGDALSQAFWIRDAAAVAGQPAGAVVVEARQAGDERYIVQVSSERFLFAAHVDAPGYVADDNYFCVMPGRTRSVRLSPRVRGRKFDATLEALNLEYAVPVPQAPARIMAP